MGKPIFKWPGGKSKLLTQLLARVPEKINTYYEPFAGGAALFFSLEGAGRFQRAKLSDLNEDLIRCYATVRDDVAGVIDALEQMNARPKTRVTYDHIRDAVYNFAMAYRVSDAAANAARFVYLQQTCFNGLYRVSKSGRFNVPFGRHKNPRVLNEDGLREACRALQNVCLEAGTYAGISPEPGDFVYIDPPYDDGFTGYTPDGFGYGDQVSLAKYLKDLVLRGVSFLASNADTPAMRNLYSGPLFRVERIEAPRSIAANGAKRKPVGELLISPAMAPQ